MNMKYGMCFYCREIEWLHIVLYIPESASDISNVPTTTELAQLGDTLVVVFYLSRNLVSRRPGFVESIYVGLWKAPGSAANYTNSWNKHPESKHERHGKELVGRRFVGDGKRLWFGFELAMCKLIKCCRGSFRVGAGRDVFVNILLHEKFWYFARGVPTVDKEGIALFGAQVQGKGVYGENNNLRDC